ncbi:unnamed protein product [Ectocarpus sp. CCAP 1310/34]|nr:unnamed protein product [Ectocarpus sp. CCAP 1310/34]
METMTAGPGTPAPTARPRGRCDDTVPACRTFHGGGEGGGGGHGNPTVQYRGGRITRGRRSTFLVSRGGRGIGYHGAPAAPSRSQGGEGGGRRLTRAPGSTILVSGGASDRKPPALGPVRPCFCR